ncbi:unnamed protein product [Brassicogethes aeneus]|uniref:Phorbol-ester/DAG-type domain-containing protein n=1 Tax=Brassicogethes aeneus TaxID=1431903 RepID=A0A9P0FKR8_BRAAE|nr:unnamed protein product [Brassicogethes aeneus]
MSKTPPNEEKLLENVSLYLSSLEDKIKIHHLQEKTNHRDWSELNPVLKSIENKTSKHTQQNVLVKASVALKAESGVEKSSSVRNSMITTEPNNENCLDNFSPQWSSKGEEIKTHNSQKKTYQKSECKFLASGICYKCTENITPKRMGRKCSKCIRTFHFKCQYNFFAKPFICIKCIIF